MWHLLTSLLFTRPPFNIIMYEYCLNRGQISDDVYCYDGEQSYLVRVRGLSCLAGIAEPSGRVYMYTATGNNDHQRRVGSANRPKDPLFLLELLTSHPTRLLCPLYQHRTQNTEHRNTHYKGEKAHVLPLCPLFDLLNFFRVT